MCEQLFPYVFFLCMFGISASVVGMFFIETPTTDMARCRTIAHAALVFFAFEILLFYDKVIIVFQWMWVSLCHGVWWHPVVLFEMFGTAFGEFDWVVPFTMNIITVFIFFFYTLLILKKNYTLP